MHEATHDGSWMWLPSSDAPSPSKAPDTLKPMPPPPWHSAKRSRQERIDPKEVNPEDDPKKGNPEDGPKKDNPEDGPKKGNPKDGPKNDNPEDGPKRGNPEDGPKKNNPEDAKKNDTEADMDDSQKLQHNLFLTDELEKANNMRFPDHLLTMDHKLLVLLVLKGELERNALKDELQALKKQLGQCNSQLDLLMSEGSKSKKRKKSSA